MPLDQERLTSHAALSVPQRVYDSYNANYSNATYRAFRDALHESAHYGSLSETQTNDEFIGDALNLLIDGGLERSGAERFRGAEAKLLQLIEPLDSCVTTLAKAHLLNFGGSPEESTTQALMDARLLAETAACSASDIHSWRGRVAFAWASTAAYLLHAALAILIENTISAYPLEKLDRGLDHLQSGVIEAHHNGFTLSANFVSWVRGKVKSRR